MLRKAPYSWTCGYGPYRPHFSTTFRREALRKRGPTFFGGGLTFEGSPSPKTGETGVKTGATHFPAKQIDGSASASESFRCERSVLAPKVGGQVPEARLVTSFFPLALGSPDMNQPQFIHRPLEMKPTSSTGICSAASMLGGYTTRQVFRVQCDCSILNMKNVLRTSIDTLVRETDMTRISTLGSPSLSVLRVAGYRYPCWWSCRQGYSHAFGRPPTQSAFLRAAATHLFSGLARCDSHEARSPTARGARFRPRLKLSRPFWGPRCVSQIRAQKWLVPL